MGVINRRRLAIVLSIASALAGIYVAGNVMGRVTTDSVISSGDAGPGQAVPAGQPGTLPPDPTGPGDPATGEPAAPVVVPVEPVAANQPVTGPGRPPLPMRGDGPHGTWRTTGAEYVALTFDDGPDPRWTPGVLELLRKHRVKATFCVVGELVEAHPHLLRDIADDGHTLCNHSWNHDFGLGSRPAEVIRQDLERTTAAIQAAVPDARVSYFRQPGGAWTERVVKVAADLGMSSLHWDVDPQDWARPGAGAISRLVASTTTEGAIVLLHDGGGERHGTVQALRSFLPDLAGRLRLAALPAGVDPPRRHGHGFPLKPGQR